MQLTQKQESLISRYLRDLAVQLGDTVPEKTRDRHLRQLQTRIYKELEALPTNAISDEDVVSVLRRAMPQGQASPASPKPALTQPRAINRQSAGVNAAPNRVHAAPPPESTTAPIWLGVCAFNAERFGLSPWMVRLFAVICGLVTGPVAVFFYLAAYAEFYVSSDRKDRPAIAYGQLALRAAAPLAVAIGLRWGAFKLLDLIAYGHQMAFSEALPPLDRQWNWLANNEDTLFFLLWTSVIPLSILSGLPLANAWGHSLKRLTQALVALYFMALCFGIASVLVGLILDRVQPYMQ